MPPAPDINPPATHGKDARLFMSTSKSGALTQVALISEWSLDMATDKVETTSLGSKNKTYVQGLRDIKGTLSGFYNEIDDAMFLGSESADGVMMAIYPTADDATFFAGPAWLDVSIKGGAAVANTIDGTFSANGGWTRTFVAPTP